MQVPAGDGAPDRALVDPQAFGRGLGGELARRCCRLAVALPRLVQCLILHGAKRLIAEGAHDAMIERGVPRKQTRTRLQPDLLQRMLH
jgi:hypothetical protein